MIARGGHMKEVSGCLAKFSDLGGVLLITH